MSKYIQFILVIFYGFITISGLYLVWFILGNGKLQLDDWLVFTIIAGWLVVCFSAVYWYTDIALSFMQIRKPVLEEEQRLIVCLHEIQKRANNKKNYRLRVEENTGLNAFAIGYHTIVVSNDCLKYLTQEELCALLAHEIGHLRTRDCMACLAFYFANLLPRFVSRIFSAGLKFIGGRVKAVAGQSLLAALITCIVLLVILSKSAVLYYLIPIVGFILLLWILNIVFDFLWLLNSRYTEYRQDAFAHQLGFGSELKQVLQKIVETGSPVRVDLYSTLTRSTHPVLHNRIRRLEKLTGLRR